MSGKALFACSKCFSRHPFEDLSAGQQLCKKCRVDKVLQKCCFCRTEYYPDQTYNKWSLACKKCEYNLSKYGKPKGCECCKIGAAFGSSKCMRCASYEEKYGPPVQCDECKQRSAFDKRDENKKYNGKLLCWLCSCAFKRALVKANDEIRHSKGKRSHEYSSSSSSGHRKNGNNDGSTLMPPMKKPSRNAEKQRSKSSHSNSSGNNNSSGANGNNNNTNIDLSDKMPRSLGNNSNNSVNNNNINNINNINNNNNNNSGNGVMSMSSIMAAPVVTIDPNSADHVVAMTNLKERIASLEKRLQMKDKDLLEKDKLLTELKGQNFEKEIQMRTKIKEIDRIHDMKVENLNRKIATLLREIALLKKSTKKNGKNNNNNNNNRGDSPKDVALSIDDQLSRDRDYNNDNNNRDNDQHNNNNNKLDIINKKDDQQQQHTQEIFKPDDDEVGSSSRSMSPIN